MIAFLSYPVLQMACVVDYRFVIQRKGHLTRLARPPRLLDEFGVAALAGTSFGAFGEVRLAPIAT